MMNNKKCGLIVAFAMAASVSGQAQKFSKWTVMPHVDFNVSNLVALYASYVFGSDPRL